MSAVKIGRVKAITIERTNSIVENYAEEEKEKERKREKNDIGRREVMVLTANFHAAEGRVRGRLVTLGEGGGSRSSAHPEALSTASTSASTPTPRLEKGCVSAFSFSPAAPAASTRLGRPVLLRQLSSSSSATV